VDIHRLPRHPIVRDNKRAVHHIIIKLTNTLDKQLIMSKVSNLKDYVNHRQKQNAEPNLDRQQKKTKSVVITDHLPHQFYRQKWLWWTNSKKHAKLVSKLDGHHKHCIISIC